MSVAAAKAKTNGRVSLPEFERLSISALGQRFDLDRATVRTRLREAGILPVEEKAKEKLFELTPRLYALLDETDTKLAAAKLQKMLADARIAEIKAAEAEGDLVPAGEFLDVVQKVFGGLFQDLAVRQPARLANKLFKAKTVSEVSAILRTDTTRRMEMLKTDWARYLGNEKK